jgi:hypothetical protein
MRTVGWGYPFDYPLFRVVTRQSWTTGHQVAEFIEGIREDVGQSGVSSIPGPWLASRSQDGSNKYPFTGEVPH